MVYTKSADLRPVQLGPYGREPDAIERDLEMDHMMQPARVRVAAYVTRSISGGWELLVFEHREYPDAGTQVPAGGVRTGELLGEAVLREIGEETGASGVTLGSALAVQQRPHPHTGEPRITVFFHAQTTETRDSWTHTVTGRDGDQDSGMVFRCRFIELQGAVDLLADSQDEFVQLVEHALGSRPGVQSREL